MVFRIGTKYRKLQLESLEARELLAADFGEVLIQGGFNDGTLISVASASLTAATLSSDLPSGQDVGTTITWSLENLAADESVRITVTRAGDAPKMLYDFKQSSTFEWTPMDDGNFIATATVKNTTTGEVSLLNSEIFRIDPIARFRPRVTPTSNPLVAIYSVPDLSSVGSSVKVQFFAPSDGVAQTYSETHELPLEAGHTSNFYVAGMRPDTTYLMRHQVLNNQGQVLQTGRFLPFTAGSLPATPFPSSVVTQIGLPGTDFSQKFLLNSLIVGNIPAGVPAFPHAVDYTGEIVWYLEDAEDTGIWRTIDGGLMYQRESFDSNTYQELRKIDLLGNVVLETNLVRINEQLSALGEDTGTEIHHESVELPNGYTAILVNVEKMFEDVQGPGLVNVLGDMIVVLDQNFQVTWTWNGFEKLDVTRVAVLGETCSGLQQAGCPPVFNTETANDWMHSNAITYDETDDNLLISMRHQDWVAKVDYSAGVGTGDVIWRLGPDGDFTFEPSETDEYPWFSHQHDPNFDSLGRLAIYDNANTRAAVLGGSNSRGQVYNIDEENMTVSLAVNADLGDFAFAVGSAQPLSNGNYHFNSGILPPGPPAANSRAAEVGPNGDTLYALTTNVSAYRSHRMASLYQRDADTVAATTSSPASLELASMSLPLYVSSEPAVTDVHGANREQHSAEGVGPREEASESKMGSPRALMQPDFAQVYYASASSSIEEEYESDPPPFLDYVLQLVLEEFSI